jgi:hypothetical protein
VFREEEKLDLCVGFQHGSRQLTIAGNEKSRQEEIAEMRR